MSFGGFFGGGSSKDKDSSSTSTSSSSSTTSSSFPSSPFSSSPSTTSNDSSAIRQRLQNAVLTQSNIINAKYLISKVNENCFNHCIQTPGTSLSSKEQTCLSACMEKYIDAWNVTSRTYIARLQKEGAQLTGISGVGANQGAAGGKELF